MNETPIKLSFGELQIKLPEHVVHDPMRKKRTDKNEIKENTTALIDFVNINTAWLIGLL